MKTDPSDGQKSVAKPGQNSVKIQRGSCRTHRNFQPGVGWPVQQNTYDQIMRHSQQQTWLISGRPIFLWWKTKKAASGTQIWKHTDQKQHPEATKIWHSTARRDSLSNQTWFYKITAWNILKWKLITVANAILSHLVRLYLKKNTDIDCSKTILLRNCLTFGKISKK